MDRDKLPELVEKTNELFREYQCTQADIKSVFIEIELGVINQGQK